MSKTRYVIEIHLQTQQGPDNDMLNLAYIDPDNNIFDNEAAMITHMNNMDYKKIANTYANNVSALHQKLDEKLDNVIQAYENLYNIFSANKSGAGLSY